MLRILLIITLILAALPWLNKAKDYTKAKVQKVQDAGEVAVDVAKKVYRHEKEK